MMLENVSDYRHFDNDKLSIANTTHGPINLTLRIYVCLQAAVDENLRLCPPVTRLDRECKKDCVVGGINFKKNVNLVFPIWAMQHNPDFFPDPEKFRPERFLKVCFVLFCFVLFIQ
jgi:cytochrome P450